MRAAAALVPGISTLVSWVWVVGGMLQMGPPCGRREHNNGEIPLQWKGGGFLGGNEHLGMLVVKGH